MVGRLQWLDTNQSYDRSCIAINISDFLVQHATLFCEFFQLQNSSQFILGIQACLEHHPTQNSPEHHLQRGPSRNKYALPPREGQDV